MSWSTDIESILNDVRENSVYLSNYHKRKYFYFKRVSDYFRIPTIVISSVASVASVGLVGYLEQSKISGIVCLLSLTVGIINSIELYLRIQDNLERELETSKSYYNLSIDLHKVLNLNQNNREGDPKLVLETFYKRYVDLVQESNLLAQNYPDKLSKVPKLKSFFNKPDSSGSSISSTGSNPLDMDATL
jgi:hypothetical protein